MIDTEHVRLMAQYNAWQNKSIYGAADTLTEEARKQQRGAFFGSIHGTLSHLLFGDQIWMHRFVGSPAPRATTIAESVSAMPDWAELRRERFAFDAKLETWAETLDPAWLEGELSWYSSAMKRDIKRPRWMLVTHMFNHQTHHRGQVHCMLTQAGAKPDDTDIPFMPGLGL